MKLTGEGTRSQTMRFVDGVSRTRVDHKDCGRDPTGGRFRRIPVYGSCGGQSTPIYRFG